MLSQAQQRKHGQCWVVKLLMKFNLHNFSIKKNDAASAGASVFEVYGLRGFT